MSVGDEVVGELVGDDVVGEAVGDDVVGEFVGAAVGDDVVGEVVGDNEHTAAGNVGGEGAHVSAKLSERTWAAPAPQSSVISRRSPSLNVKCIVVAARCDESAYPPGVPPTWTPPTNTFTLDSKQTGHGPTHCLTTMVPHPLPLSVARIVA